jgi:hypothetical protein
MDIWSTGGAETLSVRIVSMLTMNETARDSAPLTFPSRGFS